MNMKRALEEIFVHFPVVLSCAVSVVTEDACFGFYTANLAAVWKDGEVVLAASDSASNIHIAAAEICRVEIMPCCDGKTWEYEITTNNSVITIDAQLAVKS